MVGQVVFDDNTFVVRVVRKGDTLQVYAHRKVNGEEVQPACYMAGTNYLDLQKTKPQR